MEVEWKIPSVDAPQLSHEGNWVVGVIAERGNRPSLCRTEVVATRPDWFEKWASITDLNGGRIVTDNFDIILVPKG